MDDMLSSPYSLLVFFATSSSRSSSKIWPFSFFYDKRFDIQFTMSAFDLTSQIPSQPMMIKSMFSFFIFFTYGFAVIICSYADSLLLVLYSRSPIALDKLRLPFTLP